MGNKKRALTVILRTEFGRGFKAGMKNICLGLEKKFSLKLWHRPFPPLPWDASI